MKCPTCKGTGKVKPFHDGSVESRRKTAIKLRRKGFSIRQIQKALGFKSQTSVAHLLKSTQ